MAARARVFGPMALSCLVGCGGATRHAVAPTEGAGPEVESSAIDTAALSEEARARFEKEKIEVVDSDTNSTSYAFQDGRGEELSQEEFAERYQELTGRTDLDRTTHGKSGALIATGALLIGAALVGEIVLLALSSQKRQTCMPAGVSTQNPFGGPMGQFCYDSGSAVDPAVELSGSLGLVAVGGLGTALLYSGIHSNRTSNEISRDDAEDCVRRYNRALLGKALRSSR